MNFVLLKTFTKEFEAKILLGRLNSEGIETKYDSASFGPTKFAKPNHFGVYVSERDLEKAKQYIL